MCVCVCVCVFACVCLCVCINIYVCMCVCVVYVCVRGVCVSSSLTKFQVGLNFRRILEFLLTRMFNLESTVKITYFFACTLKVKAIRQVEHGIFN